MKNGIYYITFIVLILAELIKGLSANGTPPVLQDYDWQLDLAYFMWSNIIYIRIVLFAILGFLLWKMSPLKRSTIIASVLLSIIGIGIYLIFNHIWNGESKFEPLQNPKYVTAAENKILPSAQVMGININGIQKAYPVDMMTYHHQLTDKIDDQPIWVTYCGLCRSGRIFDILVEGETLDFSIIGAITYNATFQDHQSGSWWRQETGEAVKGKYTGRFLEDIPMEQMSLQNWLYKYPNSQILQRDPKFGQKYDFIHEVMSGEIERPAWFNHVTPDLIIGLEINGQDRAYDWEGLKKQRIVTETVNGVPLLLFTSEDGSSPFVYDRTVNGEPLAFDITGDTLTDSKTQSTWNLFGYCLEGELAGTQLEIIQSYYQNIRGWESFHPNSTYYEFE